MTIYKVSYVVIKNGHTGIITNQEHPPKIGDIVTLGGKKFKVLEVLELVPPRGGFHYLHVTCQPIQAE